MPREIVDRKTNEMMEELKIDPNVISEFELERIEVNKRSLTESFKRIQYYQSCRRNSKTEGSDTNESN
jgi:hypothetical protein